ncbi:type III secretion system (T3SS) negative regulator GrlR [Rhodopseudomonas thermotolerans]|uniref:Type III secretion system (T3SS) negative regulator GrlR n=2 Tax=Rhodopseudomonas TaxID=1073 RepID=A0A336JTN9_9BRAD|nr:MULTISPECIES: GrlR family regulatory protein [Rhodopseudomonas]RED27631.1 type III secretion system (T3SS) negative regulator GrlR [Rhodopseudomonas pentothenatexigens]REF91169.1 type III secretion system (T3SS) negative regulator GrlR [Rhodopseudomonas thermotolerans]SSW92902.1 type III secretion system (T3SS) negative regulator GrlR [Rhodopseudomonas pentothenatexigens]
MQNGLYSIHIRMLDGIRARSNGVIILRDGHLLGGDPYFFTTGHYDVGDGRWKGELVTRQHTPYSETPGRPLFSGHEVTTGFSGSFTGGWSEVFGTSLVGSRSVAFRATLRLLAAD